MNKNPKYIVVIGASAGGLDALCELVKNFVVGLDVAYCIVLHLSRKGIGDFVVHRLSKVTSVSCSLAEQGQEIERDHIYIARPNQHLLVKDNRLILGGGPEENRFRPSIDVLFRSAAVAYNSHSIGVILSGMLDDGTSGMWAIKRSGGICVVQDPDQAEYPDMPLSIINNMEADYVIGLTEIGPLIGNLVQQERGISVIPEEVVLESQIAEKTAVSIDTIEKIANTSVFACPDCGGNLWEMKNDIIKRYRCHIGHAYTERDLVIKQAEAATNTLWVALRMMEERKHLLSNLKADHAKKGYRSLSEQSAEKHDEMELHIIKLKEMLFSLQNQNTD